MKTRLILFISFFNALHLFGQETFPVNGISNNFKPIYAFTNATIVVSPDNIIKNGVLIIQEDKIIDVDSNINIPKEAIVRDLNGDYIYPSFIDLYSDYGMNEIKKEPFNYNPQYKSKKDGAYHWNQAIHPEINSINEFLFNEKDASKYHNNGFGTVLTHIQDGLIRGSGGLVLLKNDTEHENILKENAATFFSFKKGSSRQKNPSSLMGSIALIRQTFLDAEWYLEQKDQINLSYDSFNKQKELPKIFSITHTLDYSRVAKIADEFEVEFIIKGNGKEFNRVSEVKNSLSSVIVPVNFPKAYDVSDPEKAKNISLERLKEWELSPYNLKILSDNNISFCITSSDLEDSKEFLKNLRLAVEKGLSKQSALAALTINPARLINCESFIGTIKKGNLANFLITSNDIFEDGKIYENWVAGKQFILNKKQRHDIRGYYTFKSEEFENEYVEVKGSRENPILTIYKLDSIKMKTILSDDKINISLNNGEFRAVGKYHEGLIFGRYQNKNGAFFDFNMKRDSLYIEPNDTSKQKKSYSLPLIWHPNKAYGFTSLPKVKSIIFRNATVWTNEEEGIMLNTDVIIKNGKIIAIGTLLNPLKYFKEGEFTTIDASNLHLTSGIIDEHSHIAISRGVNEGTQASSAEVRIGDVINSDDHNIYRQLAGGTVAAQLLHGSANPIGGQSAMIKLRWGESAEKMKIKDASGFIKFALGENVKQSNWGDLERIRYPQTRMGVEQVFYDAFYRAKNYKESWITYNNLSLTEKRKTLPPREDLELNALVEILNDQRFITCHSYVQSEINMLMHVADSMGFTVNIFTHILEGYKVANKMKKHGAGASTFSDWWAYKFEVNDAIPYNACLLSNAGVLTAINSDDAEMGRRLNQEAAKAVKYGGCSEEEAWKMITLNPAKLLHLDNKMGSIKIGKDADIVLWNKNPLSIYASVQQTYVDGKLMYDKEKDKELRAQNLNERMRIIKLMSLDKNKKVAPPKKTKEKHYHCDTLHEE